MLKNCDKTDFGGVVGIVVQCLEVIVIEVRTVKDVTF